jgi:hypothetical protein
MTVYRGFDLEEAQLSHIEEPAFLDLFWNPRAKPPASPEFVALQHVSGRSARQNRL